MSTHPLNLFRDVPFWGQQGSLGKCWRFRPESKSKMKDASCNSPGDKRKINQIRATSTKCHISDTFEGGNEGKLKYISDPTLFNSY